VSFRRHHPVGPYVLDFYSPALKVAIELDGDQHLQRQAFEARRTRYLNAKGIRVIRFWNVEVNETFYGVCERIAEVMEALTPTRNAARSAPLLSGGGILVP